MSPALVNPAGRLDVLVLRLVEHGFRCAFTPAYSARIFEAVRPAVEKELRRVGIPDKAITPAEVLGLLLNPPKTKRGRR